MTLLMLWGIIVMMTLDSIEPTMRAGIVRIGVAVPWSCVVMVGRWIERGGGGGGWV